MAVTELTDESFQKEVLESDKVVLVDFWAPWCAPCQMVGPEIEKAAEEVGDKAKICKMNVDENQKVASEFEVRSIPNVMIFKNGKMVESIVGLRPKEEYLFAINRNLS